VLALAVVTVVVLAAVLVPVSPWRNPEGGFLPASPLLDSMVFVVFTYFAVGGYAYGRVAGTISGFGDVPRMMGEALRDMTPFLVLAFVLGQFIALFDWSGVGSGRAVAGADGLRSIGLTGLPVIVLLTFVRRYEPQAGLGTLMARMLPFVIPFWISWVAVLLIFVQLGIPFGPGNGVYVEGIG